MQTRPTTAAEQNESLWRFWALAGLIILYRFAISIFGGFNLGFDEAYYWYWSQHPAFGYYSKPPLMAWFISLTTQVCGSSEVCVRLTSLIAYPITTFLIYLIGKQLFNARVGVIAGLLFLTMPGVALGNVLITTDSVLLLFWAASLFMLFRALDTNHYRDWLLLGICSGLGLLGKYTMVLFAPSVLLLLALFPEYRSQLRNPRLYLAMVVALLVFAPNIYWNIENHFPTLQHTVEISHMGKAGLKFAELAGFLLAQFGVFGLISFALLLGYGFKLIRHWQSSPAHWLLPFTLVFLAVISLQALLGGANANWAAPTYITASLIVAGFLVKRNSRVLLVVLFAINILMGAIVYHFDQILNLAGVTLTRKNDAYKALRGWRNLGEQVQPFMDAHPDALLLSDSRHDLAELIYYLHPHPLNAVKWNPQGRVKDHFDLVTSMQDKIGKNFIYVTANKPDKGIAEAFGKVTQLASIDVIMSPEYARTYTVYLLENFQGYPAAVTNP